MGIGWNQDGSWQGESYGNTTTYGNDKITRFWGERVVFMNNKIIRKKLYEFVPYSHRRYIEDTPTIIPILWYANKVEYVDMLGYNYVMRESSLTHNTNLLKDVIYKGLCWLDLLDFFEDKDTSIFKEVDIPAYLKNIISCLNSMNGLTTKDIEPYLVDWQEFTLMLINRISVHEVSFK